MGEFPLPSVPRRDTRLRDLAARGFRHGLRVAGRWQAVQGFTAACWDVPSTARTVGRIQRRAPMC